MENQHVMTSPVTRPAAVIVPAASTHRVARHRPTIPAATRHLFGFTIRHSFGTADGKIHIADPVRESLARATISAASVRTANPSRDSAVRSPTPRSPGSLNLWRRCPCAGYVQPGLSPQTADLDGLAAAG
jgi:hypothetical protein